MTEIDHSIPNEIAGNNLQIRETILSIDEIFNSIAIHDIVKFMKENRIEVEKYNERNDKSENVVEFITRVYAENLDGNFTRGDLRALDPACYNALYYFENNQGAKLDRAELNLPTAAEREKERYRSSPIASNEFAETNGSTKEEMRRGPLVAPELYMERELKAEKAPSFILRVYGEWLDGDFTRADLRRLDRKCAYALRDYEARNGKVPLAELKLPTVKQRNDRLLALEDLPNDPKERRRLQVLRSKRREIASGAGSQLMTSDQEPSP